MGCNVQSMLNSMRIVAALVAFTFGMYSPGFCQGLPVHVAPRVVPGTSEAARADDLFRAYLRKRLEALGIKIVETSNVTSLEVNSSVLPTGGTYDVAAVLTIINCDLPTTPPMCIRSAPFDWMQQHEAQDLEVVARKMAENVYAELGPVVKLMRLTDSIERARKP